MKWQLEGKLENKTQKGYFKMGEKTGDTGDLVEGKYLIMQERERRIVRTVFFSNPQQTRLNAKDEGMFLSSEVNSYVIR